MSANGPISSCFLVNTVSQELEIGSQKLCLASAKKIPSVTPEEVKHVLDTQEDAEILDVRTTEEYSRGHLVGSTHLPLDRILDDAETVLKDKQKTIYVYCLSGSRSIFATESLQKLGFSNVFNMTGGLLGWRAKKYPLTS